MKQLYIGARTAYIYIIENNLILMNRAKANGNRYAYNCFKETVFNTYIKLSKVNELIERE